MSLRAVCGALVACLAIGSANADDPAVRARPSGESPELWAPPTITLEAGWQRMKLPATRFGYLVVPNEPNFSSSTPPIYRTASKVTNHNGIFDGARWDAALEGIRLGFLPASASLGVKGFYVGHGDSQRSHCVPGPGAPNGDNSGNPPYCVVGPLVDDPTTVDGATGGSNEIVRFNTARHATHWGIGTELKMPLAFGGALAEPLLAAKFGIAYRRIDQSLSLNAVGDGNTPNNTANWRYVAYREGLATDYLGAYVGFGSRYRFANGIVVAADGEVGLYDANSRYRGTYAESGDLFAPGLRGPATQALALSHDQAAVIAALKVAADKDFGSFKVGVFARGEYYSHAPAMAYNDTQLDPINGVVGPNNGTSITSGNAWTFSLGARLNVPLGGLTR